MFVVCERWVETRTDCYIDPSSSLDHNCTSFASWLGLLNQESLRAQSPQSAAGSHFGILSPTDPNCQGTWLYYFQTSTGFRCSSVYLYRCISWLTARSRVSIYSSYLSSGKDKEIHIFPKGISPKVIAMTPLEFEPAYYDFSVQHVSTMRNKK